MKASKDFFIHDNEVRLHDEPDGGCVSQVLGIVRGRISVIFSAVVLLLFLWLMVSCSDSKEQEVLNHVESVIEQHPDSALILLRGVDKASLGSNKERARYALLMSMALDKSYIDTTTFDIIQPAIEYYLDKGTPDEKLKTLYYQGRISMLKTLRKFEENPEAALGASLGIGIKAQNRDNSDNNLDFLETDYR